MAKDFNDKGHNGQTDQSTVTATVDNDRFIDPALESLDSDKIPQHVLDNKHLCPDIIIVYNRLALR